MTDEKENTQPEVEVKDKKKTFALAVSEKVLKKLAKSVQKKRKTKRRFMNAPYFASVNGMPIIMKQTSKDSWEATDREDLLHAPLRRKGNLSFDNLDGWAKFVKQFQTDESNIYIQADLREFTFKATTIFNDGHKGDEPAWRDYRAEFSPDKSTQFMNWMEHNNRNMRQEEMAYFLEDHLDDIVGDDINSPSAAQVLEAVTDLRQLTNVSFRSGVDLSNGMRKFEFVEKDGSNGSVSVPREFLIGIPVFEDETVFTIRARLRYKIDRNDGSLMFWYQLQQIERVFKTAITQLQTRLEELIADEIPIYKGAIEL